MTTTTLDKDERNYIPLEPEKLEFPIREMSNLLNKIDHLSYDIQRIETFLSNKYNLTRPMIRQIAIEYHKRDFTDTLTELNLLHREQELQRNPASIINPPEGVI